MLIGGKIEVFDLESSFWTHLVEFVRRARPALLPEPPPGRHRVRARVYWTGTRPAAAEDYAPRLGTPTAVLMAEVPTFSAIAEPTRA